MIHWVEFVCILKNGPPIRQPLGDLSSSTVPPIREAIICTQSCAECKIQLLKCRAAIGLLIKATAKTSPVSGKHLSFLSRFLLCGPIILSILIILCKTTCIDLLKPTCIGLLKPTCIGLLKPTCIGLLKPTCSGLLTQ